MNGLGNNDIKSYEYFPDPPVGYFFMGVRTMYGDKVRWVISSNLINNDNDRIQLTIDDIVVNNVDKVSVNENHQTDTAIINVTIPLKCRLEISNEEQCIYGVTIQKIDPPNFTSNTTQWKSISVTCAWIEPNGNIMCNNIHVKLVLTALSNSDYKGTVSKTVEVANYR